MLGSDDAAFANIVNPFSASDADLESEPVVQLTLPEDVRRYHSSPHPHISWN